MRVVNVHNNIHYKYYMFLLNTTSTIIKINNSKFLLLYDNKHLMYLKRKGTWRMFSM